MKVIDEWADEGIEPPESNYPRLETDTLVSLSAYRASFPSVPNFQPPSVKNEIDVLDFGPGFGPQGGVQTVLPPIHGSRYNVLLPRLDQPRARISGEHGRLTRGADHRVASDREQEASCRGSEGLKVGKQVFAMEVKGKLVVKVSLERASELRDAGLAQAFDPGHGRPMKQWVSVAPRAKVDWLELSREGLVFVRG